MIKIKKHLNYKGILYEPGAIVSLAPEAEKCMVDNGLAEFYISGQTLEPEKGETAMTETQEETPKDDAKRANRKRL